MQMKTNCSLKTLQQRIETKWWPLIIALNSSSNFNHFIWRPPPISITLLACYLEYSLNKSQQVCFNGSVATTPFKLSLKNALCLWSLQQAIRDRFVREDRFLWIRQRQEARLPFRRLLSPEKGGNVEGGPAIYTEQDGCTCWSLSIWWIVNGEL